MWGDGEDDEIAVTCHHQRIGEEKSHVHLMAVRDSQGLGQAQEPVELEARPLAQPCT